MAKPTKTEIALQLHKIPDPYAPPPSMEAPGLIFPHPDNMNAYSQKSLREICAAGLEGPN